MNPTPQPSPEQEAYDIAEGLAGYPTDSKSWKDLLAQLTAIIRERDEWKALHAQTLEGFVAVEKQRDSFREKAEQAVVALGNMLDETLTTYRGEWPRELFCRQCNCNISKGNPHTDACLIGQADAVYESLLAAINAAKSNP